MRLQRAQSRGGGEEGRTARSLGRGSVAATVGRQRKQSAQAGRCCTHPGEERRGLVVEHQLRRPVAAARAVGVNDRRRRERRMQAAHVQVAGRDERGRSGVGAADAAADAARVFDALRGLATGLQEARREWPARMARAFAAGHTDDPRIAPLRRRSVRVPGSAQRLARLRLGRHIRRGAAVEMDWHPRKVAAVQVDADAACSGLVG